MVKVSCDGVPRGAEISNGSHGAASASEAGCLAEERKDSGTVRCEMRGVIRRGDKWRDPRRCNTRSEPAV